MYMPIKMSIQDGGHLEKSMEMGPIPTMTQGPN